MQTLGISRFYKNLSFQRFLKHCLRFLEYYLWWKFWQNLAIFGGVRAQNLPKKGHFMDAESVRKTWKIYNLTIENSILIKLKHNYVSLWDHSFAKKLGRNS